jgi:putative transposase
LATITLVRENDTIYHEDLQTANMIRNHHLATSTSDAGCSLFLNILSFKAACAGRRVIAIPPVFTGQNRSGCGVVVQKGFSVRCSSRPECGTSLRRDRNAALNILRLAQAQRSRPG